MEEFLKLHLPDDSPSSSLSNRTPVKSQVSSLVFLDLETTGLPSNVGKKNVHITELSLVAVSRTEFQNSSAFRVLNKLSLCIRPRSEISFGAMCVTGLYNDMLEMQQPFDDSVPKILEIFFSRLQSPICLLAHNGRRYDFPILQAELKRLGFTLPKNIMCADTLEAFRTIGLVAPNLPDTQKMQLSEKNVISQNPTQYVEVNKHHNEMTVQCDANMTDSEVDKLLSKDIEIFQFCKMPEEAAQNQCFSANACFTKIYPNFEPQSNFSMSKPNDCTFDQNDPINTDELIYTLQNGRIKPGSVEKTPNKISTSGNNLNDDTTQVKNGNSTFVPMSIALKSNTTAHAHGSFIPAKRKLFSKEILSLQKKLENNEPQSTSNTNNKAKKRVQYSLEKLYIHYFGENPPDNHHAESDCINLSKVCQKVSKVFLPWLDENNTPFSEVIAMW